MKSGLFTITSCEKDDGASERSLHYRHQKPIFFKRRLWWVFGEISKIFFILSCSQGTKLSIPHTSLVTRKKLLELGWEVMPHPPYSPNLAPSDYHLFRSLQNHLNGKIFDSNKAVKNKREGFFNGECNYWVAPEVIGDFLYKLNIFL